MAEPGRHWKYAAKCPATKNAGVSGLDVLLFCCCLFEDTKGPYNSLKL